ncbi:hypothetical protein PsYK624_050490 [Phanerochaete sordida]|uniref:Uncharacterized protein n=1 Tax=Phanerochaete sordida TaxID=48140 RepID=A0A9P3LAZ8_9APHY|nr:hypothetical protein PsYK624_050490 [Phanerochaete sordida]
MQTEMRSARFRLPHRDAIERRDCRSLSNVTGNDGDSGQGSRLSRTSTTARSATAATATSSSSSIAPNKLMQGISSSSSSSSSSASSTQNPSSSSALFTVSSSSSAPISSTSSASSSTREHSLSSPSQPAQSRSSSTSGSTLSVSTSSISASSASAISSSSLSSTSQRITSDTSTTASASSSSDLHSSSNLSSPQATTRSSQTTSSSPLPPAGAIGIPPTASSPTSFLPTSDPQAVESSWSPPPALATNTSPAQTAADAASSRSVSRVAVIAGTAGSVGGLALLAGVVCLFFWCRRRKAYRASYAASEDPLWRRRSADAASLGASLRLPTPALRPGHGSGMAMVQVSDDPFGATPPSFSALGTPALGTPPPDPYDAYASDTPRSTTHLVESAASSVVSPDWAPRRFPNLPVIRVQSASTDSHYDSQYYGAAELARASAYMASARSSYASADAGAPRTPEEERWKNPFADPPANASSESLAMSGAARTPEEERWMRNPFAHRAASASNESVATPGASPVEAHGDTVLRDMVGAHTAARTTARMTMRSLKADVVATPSPVDSIDRFWDIPVPPPKGGGLSAAPSSESLLRTVSPGPGPTSRRIP